MDPITLVALGLGLYKALDKLLEKGVLDPALEKGLEPLRKRLTRGYDRKQAEAELLKPVQAALKTVPDKDYSDWLSAFALLNRQPILAARFAAAALEQITADREPPTDLLPDLKLPTEQSATLKSVLWKLRGELALVEPYKAGIAYADSQYAKGRLDGLYDLVAGAIGYTENGQSFVWTRELAPDRREIERPYLNYLCEELGAPAMDARAKDKARGESLRLEKVYIALYTTEERRVAIDFDAITDTEKLTQAIDRETNRKHYTVSALQAVIESQRLVLLGDPGSGKSTFAQHLALCLAQARRNHSQAREWLNELGTGENVWTLPPYLPVLIRLRAFAADREVLPDDRELGQAKHLLAYLRKTFQASEFTKLHEHLLRLLDSDDALLIFDGLDEVPDPKRRLKVAEAIEDFCLKRFARARALITCRARQYQPDDVWVLKTSRFPVFRLDNLDSQQVEQFVKSWFNELQARGREADPAYKIQTLLSPLTLNPQLRELAVVPILLTQMAIVHAADQLPESRIKVYSECSELLLWQWEVLRAKHSQRLETADEFVNGLGVLGLKLDSLRKALDEAVFRAHAEGEPEISGERLRAALKPCFEAQGAPEAKQLEATHAFITGWLNGRNGLLLPATGDDSFDVPHRSFREFMAGRHLHASRVPSPKSGKRERWDVSGPHLFHTDPDKWREVFRFAAGLEESNEELADALDRLCPKGPTLEDGPTRALFLTAQTTLDVSVGKLRHRDNDKGLEVYARLETQLIQLSQNTSARPATRLEAGNLLDALGWNPPDLYDFVPVTYPDKLILNPELKQLQSVSQTQTCFIAKFPVTNQQYARFLDSDDYKKDKTLWAGLQAYDLQGKTIEMGERALDWWKKQGGPNHQPPYWNEARFGQHRRLAPVVTVTWYEAAAYCAWLTRCLQRELEIGEWQALKSFIPNLQSLTCRLPLESEWEAAAGGLWAKPVEDDTPRYPWQATLAEMTDEEIQKHANTAESKFGTTSPVGLYPSGASPSDVQELAGNVWEWQANFYNKDSDTPALRGGAWGDVRWNARVAVRGGYDPHSQGNGIGLRVVVASVSR